MFQFEGTFKSLMVRDNNHKTVEKIAIKRINYGINAAICSNHFTSYKKFECFMFIIKNAWKLLAIAKGH